MTLKQFNLKRKVSKLLKGDFRANAIFQIPRTDVVLMMKLFDKMPDKELLDLVDSFDYFQMVSRGLYECVIRALEVYTATQIFEIFGLVKEFHENPNY